MGKTKTVYVCQQCGARTSRWAGRCAGCGEWNTIVEEVVTQEAGVHRPSLARDAPQPISKVQPVRETRIPTQINELDRILGGGTVVGSTVLIGGDPGIGKSTLLLQASSRVAEQGYTVLYTSSEESVLQTKLRAERLGVTSDNLLLVAETNIEAIAKHIENTQPSLTVIDSVQMVYKPQLESAPGTVSQVRECATDLIYLAKRTNMPIFFIGHVTKEGAIAGPRILEHIVDTVLYFEGDKFHTFRILRAVKNRFGSTNEIGIFEMRGDGLAEVANPSQMFLSENRTADSGSIIVPCIEGTRALLVEVQALVSRANFGVPERKVTGADYNRVSMLLAVLDKRVGLHFGGQDVFVNVVGGVRIDEPAADLGIALAMASSFRERPIARDLVAIGEVGLGSEVRGVTQIDTRLREAQKLGFKRALVPEANTASLDAYEGLEITKVMSVGAALEQIE